MVPVDTLNGVFRKLDRPVELAHGAILLIGREVLRFEKLDHDDVKQVALGARSAFLSLLEGGLTRMDALLEGAA